MPIPVSVIALQHANSCVCGCPAASQTPHPWKPCCRPIPISMVALQPTNPLSVDALQQVNAYMSQLLRVDPSALASSPPAIGWRPACRGRPGATRDGCDLYTFILWAGSTRRDREGGSCSVLYSDLLRAVGTPVPGEMINGANHYGGSPLILLNKGFANGRQGARRRPGRRRVNETKRLATDEPATRLVSARGV